MGFGDFAPPAGGNMKRVTKAALRRMAEKFQQADEISQEIHKKEEEERKKIAPDMDATLDW